MKMQTSLFPILRSGLLLLLLAVPAWAADTSPALWHPTTMSGAIVATLVFGGIGIGLAILGFKLFDAVIKFNLEQEICEKQNVAAAILSAAMILGICIIVAATLLG